MSPLDWYSYFETPPGFLHQDSGKRRFFGGPLNGKMISPPQGEVIEYLTSEEGKIIYYQFKLFHAPQLGCEGPCAIEVVMATSSSKIMGRNLA